KEIVDNAKLTNVEIIALKKSGETFSAEISGNVIKDSAGNPNGFVFATRDRTERKQLDEQLKESELKYRKQFEEAMDAIFVADTETGLLIDCNRAATKLVGSNKSEIVGMHQRILHPPEEIWGEFSRTFEKHIEEKEGQVLETQVITKTGEIRDVAIKANIFELGGKKLIQGIFRDITEQKKAESDLYDTFDELTLANEKLGVVGRLTRHDVRNKLSAVTGNIYLAKQALPKDNEVVKYLNETEFAVDQIEKIFDFARTYEQLGVEERSYVDVEKSFERATLLLSGLSEIEVVNDCGGVKVLADSLLDTLFYNLLDNSLRHGEKVSRIGIYHKISEDGLKLIYEDDGIGIPEAEKELVFKEGYGKNTGLGLYMIKKMCNVYGWNIQETGEHGKGAQFTITIPNSIIS
ncbi:MAG: PAS domain-containing sensor histidine kinase, partial [Candidatus Bathyarchaeota archaeon]